MISIEKHSLRFMDQADELAFAQCSLTFFEQPGIQVLQRGFTLYNPTRVITGVLNVFCHGVALIC